MKKETAVYKSLIGIDSELNQIQDLDLLLERLLFEARKTIRADAGSIYVKQKLTVVDEKDGTIRHEDALHIKYSQNDTLQKKQPLGDRTNFSVFSKAAIVPISEKSISGYVALTGKILNVEDMYNIPKEMPYSFNDAFDKLTGYRCQSSLTFPLKTADGKLLGVIQVINAKDEKGNIVGFTVDDEFLITHFAANATAALQRAFENRAMILRMMRMSELRDPKETGTHVNRVAGFAVEIYDLYAKKHNIPQKERDNYRDILRIGAMLHDIGKVAISDTILKKPARFTPEEFLIMQQHSAYGASLFCDPQSPIDVIAGEIALTHHENWDGTGYPGWIDPETLQILKEDADGKPLGKKGEEIPLSGRIVAIADVYDALRSKRVYKEAYNNDFALEEMKKMRGTKFDPELVDIFFEALPNIQQAEKLYPEQ